MKTSTSAEALDEMLRSLAQLEDAAAAGAAAATAHRARGGSGGGQHPQHQSAGEAAAERRRQRRHNNDDGDDAVLGSELHIPAARGEGTDDDDDDGVSALYHPNSASSPVDSSLMMEDIEEEAGMCASARSNHAAAAAAATTTKSDAPARTGTAAATGAPLATARTASDHKDDDDAILERMLLEAQRLAMQMRQQTTVTTATTPTSGNAAAAVATGATGTPIDERQQYMQRQQHEIRRRSAAVAATAAEALKAGGGGGAVATQHRPQQLFADEDLDRVDELLRTLDDERSHVGTVAGALNTSYGTEPTGTLGAARPPPSYNSASAVADVSYDASVSDASAGGAGVGDRKQSSSTMGLGAFFRRQDAKERHPSSSQQMQNQSFDESKSISHQSVASEQLLGVEAALEQVREMERTLAELGASRKAMDITYEEEDDGDERERATGYRYSSPTKSNKSASSPSSPEASSPETKGFTPTSRAAAVTAAAAAAKVVVGYEKMDLNACKQGDEDYVRIVDYSNNRKNKKKKQQEQGAIASAPDRGDRAAGTKDTGGSGSVASTSKRKKAKSTTTPDGITWEKIDAPDESEDDYAPLADYTHSPSTGPSSSSPSGRGPAALSAALASSFAAIGGTLRMRRRRNARPRLRGGGYARVGRRYGDSTKRQRRKTMARLFAMLSLAVVIVLYRRIQSAKKAKAPVLETEIVEEIEEHPGLERIDEERNATETQEADGHDDVEILIDEVEDGCDVIACRWVVDLFPATVLDATCPFDALPGDDYYDEDDEDDDHGPDFCCSRANGLFIGTEYDRASCYLDDERLDDFHGIDLDGEVHDQEGVADEDPEEVEGEEGATTDAYTTEAVVLHPICENPLAKRFLPLCLVHNEDMNVVFKAADHGLEDVKKIISHVCENPVAKRLATPICLLVDKEVEKRVDAKYQNIEDIKNLIVRLVHLIPKTLKKR